MHAHKTDGIEIREKRGEDGRLELCARRDGFGFSFFPRFGQMRE